MTIYEHAMVGINGTLAWGSSDGMDGRSSHWPGWRRAAGLDGLTIIFGLHGTPKDTGSGATICWWQAWRRQSSRLRPIAPMLPRESSGGL